jgi:mannose-6-phosphate isomerase-like protein (cupin superfamily)
MAEAAKFQIVRAAAGYRFGEEGVVTDNPTPLQAAGLQRMLEAGALDGAQFTLLCDLPGFNLTHVWAKRDYPLVLHSHSVDCLYHIIAGSARLGTENLGAGDSLFVPANHPYTYTAGPDGVELLEIRQTGATDYKNLAKGQAFYDKAVATITANRDAWRAAAKPPRDG